MRRLLLPLTLLLAFALPGTAAAGPVATSDAQYDAFGRVFPDPQGGLCATAGIGPCSPKAQGRVPATTFLGFGEFEQALRYMNARPDWRRYMEVWPLSTGRFPGNALDLEFTPDPSYRSAGTPTSTLDRARHELYVVRVTDETVPDAGKVRYVLSLSIHGIERAGVEGGVRAMEDLVTAATTRVGGGSRLTQPILTTKDLGVAVPTFGDVLQRAIVYFVFPNPDGWARGSLGDGGINFQRYNGNGVDLNRDFEDIGYSFRQYSSKSEPESRALSTVLKQIAERGGRFSGGDDLHGQVAGDSFSYTLLPHGSHDFAKNGRLLQAARTINKVQSDVLGWSPLITPGDQARGCADVPVAGRACAQVPGQTFGTVYDTIQYTVTGALGDFFDSTIGLNADGVDNEMSYSHLVPDIVFSDQIEQLHVDGNAGLIYAHLAELLGGRTFPFPARGRKGYVANPRVAGAERPLPDVPPGTRPQADIDRTITGTPDALVAEFPVVQDAATYNGGMRVTVTHVNVQGNAPTAALATLKVQCKGCDEHPGVTEDGWVDVAQDFNQSPVYLQAGMVATVNRPQAARNGKPVAWRVVVSTPGVPAARLHVDFTSGPASGTGDTGGGAAPRQRAYNVASTDFWAALNPYAPRGNQYEEVDPAKKLPALDTLVVTDVVPGDARFAARARAFAERGGNLVLTDGALRLLPALFPAIGADAVRTQKQYLGQVVFAKADVAGRDPGDPASTTKDPLAAGVDEPGARFNLGLKRQTYEPVPIGFKITEPDGADAATAPQWSVDRAAFERAGGRVAGIGVEPGPSPSVASVPGQVTLGELPLGKGVVRIVGGLLPQPTEAFDHEAGLEPHGVTYTGYQLAMNLTNWCRPDNTRCGEPFGASAAARDRLRPSSRILRSRSRLRRSGLRLGGTARDRAPRGILPRVARVDVALALRTGSRCRFLGARGRFGTARSCSRPQYVRARGTSRWTRRVSRTLPAGRYVAITRAADRFGNRERSRTTANVLRFRLR